jgi:hypothetical protein
LSLKKKGENSGAEKRRRSDGVQKLTSARFRLGEELVPTAVGDRDSPERRHSAADLPEFTRLHFHERRQDQRCQWCKYRKACPLGAEHHDANAPMAQVLLVTKILIGRDERVVLLLCCVEEWAVVQV